MYPGSIFRYGKWTQKHYVLYYYLLVRILHAFVNNIKKSKGGPYSMGGGHFSLRKMEPGVHLPWGSIFHLTLAPFQSPLLTTLMTHTRRTIG